jgi:hypothetical protein
MVVFDGLRPDLARAATALNLHRFAGQETRFVEARSAFPSVTRVCTSSVAAGARRLPCTASPVARFHLGIDARRPLDLATIEDLRPPEQVDSHVMQEGGDPKRGFCRRSHILSASCLGFPVFLPPQSADSAVGLPPSVQTLLTRLCCSTDPCTGSAQWGPCWRCSS